MTSSTRNIIIGLVVAGIIGLFVIGFVMGAALYGWKAAQRAGNEAAAQQDLKTVAAVEIQYYNTHSRTFGTIDQLIKEEMLTSKFAGDPTTTDGYIFTLRLTPKTASQPGSYALSADPQSTASATNHFYVDSTSPAIHANPDGPAGPNDPPPKD
jgi:type II secretory pathway pseudopilin PulG